MEEVEGPSLALPGPEASGCTSGSTSGPRQPPSALSQCAVPTLAATATRDWLVTARGQGGGHELLAWLQARGPAGSLALGANGRHSAHGWTL